MDPDDLTSILSTLANKLDKLPADGVEWADYDGSALRIGYLDDNRETQEFVLEVRVIAS